MNTAVEILLATKKAEWQVLKNFSDSQPEPNSHQVEIELTADFFPYSCNIHKQNTLIIISFGLL